MSATLIFRATALICVVTGLRPPIKLQQRMLCIKCRLDRRSLFQRVATPRLPNEAIARRSVEFQTVLAAALGRRGRKPVDSLFRRSSRLQNANCSSVRRR